MENGIGLTSKGKYPLHPFPLVYHSYRTFDKFPLFSFHRTGKAVNLTIVEQVSPNSSIIRSYSSSGTVTGFSSVLNLDKDHSKFFVGGLPANFEAPEAIRKATFSGDVEELTVDGAPVGLWNFVSISSNTPNAPASAIRGAKGRYCEVSST